MTVDVEIVQRIVDKAAEEYNERSGIPEDLVHRKKTLYNHRTCDTSKVLDRDVFDTTTHFAYIGRKIQELVDCEIREFIQELEENSDISERMCSDTFIRDIIQYTSNTHSPCYLFLPDGWEFERAMQRAGSYSELNLRPRTPVHWYNSNILDETQGFLVEDGVYLEQCSQGKSPVLPKRFDEVLDTDNSGNRLKVTLTQNGFNYKLTFSSQFLLNKLDTDSPLIHTLELPVPEDLETGDVH